MHHLMDEMEQNVADLRDRTAASLAATDQSDYGIGMARRALERLTDAMGDLRDDLARDLDASTDRMVARVDDLRDDLAPDTSPSWMSRLTWITIGAGIGAAAAMLLDDERASDRRDRLGVKAQELAEDAQRTAQHQMDVQRGKAEGAVNLVSGDRDPEDPKTLRQKIRSEVIGRVEGTDDVVVVIHDAGRVELKGLVEDRTTVERLLASVEAMPGVSDVSESLQVKAG